MAANYLHSPVKERSTFLDLPPIYRIEKCRIIGHRIIFSLVSLWGGYNWTISKCNQTLSSKLTFSYLLVQLRTIDDLLSGRIFSLVVRSIWINKCKSEIIMSLVNERTFYDSYQVWSDECWTNGTNSLTALMSLITGKLHTEMILLLLYAIPTKPSRWLFCVTGTTKKRDSYNPITGHHSSQYRISEPVLANR